MYHNLRLLLSVTLAILVLPNHQVSAALIVTPSSGLTVINDRSAFEALFDSVEVETFDSFPDSQDAFLNRAFDFGFYSVRNDLANVEINERSGDIDKQGSNVVLNAHLSVNDGTITIDLEKTVTSFGFDIFSWANGRPGRLTLNNQEFVDVVDDASQDLFWGIVSDTRFSRLTFTQLGGIADGLELDNFTLGAGAIVPEPSHGGLLLLALSGVYAVRRRQKRIVCDQTV